MASLRAIGVSATRIAPVATVAKANERRRLAYGSATVQKSWRASRSVRSQPGADARPATEVALSVCLTFWLFLVAAIFGRSARRQELNVHESRRSVDPDRTPGEGTRATSRPLADQTMKEATIQSGIARLSADMTAFAGPIQMRLHAKLHALKGTRLAISIAFSEIHSATRSIVKHSHTFIAGSPTRRRCTHASRQPNIPFDILFPMSSLQACIWAIVRRPRTVEPAYACNVIRRHCDLCTAFLSTARTNRR